MSNIVWLLHVAQATITEENGTKLCLQWTIYIGEMGKKLKLKSIRKPSSERGELHCSRKKMTIRLFAVYEMM